MRLVSTLEERFIPTGSRRRRLGGKVARRVGLRPAPRPVEPVQWGGMRVRSVHEGRINRKGLTAGTPAPAFALPDLAGNEHSLAEFRGRRMLLMFMDPSCRPCDELAPELVALHEEHRLNGREIVLISRGDLEANRAKAQELGFSFLPVLLQKGWRVSKDYGMFATPIAYLIDEAGVIERDVAVGLDGVRELFAAHDGGRLAD
jgi:peroxiredoxin